VSSKRSASTIFEDPIFLQQLNEAAAEAGKQPQQARKYAEKCLREIEATPDESWLRPAAKMARFIYTRSYEAQLDINLEALEQLREASKDKLLLFLWSHKSHMDSFVFLLSLYEQQFRPLPLIFAGVNMTFLGFGARSRTGKLSPPKLGILNWVVESCYRENMQDVLLVPVSIAFDRIAEIDDYVAIQTGQPKRKESLRWFIDYIFGMRQPYGKVYVRYGEPVALGQDTGLSPGMLPQQVDEQRGQVTRMAFEVCQRIEQITPIKSADVLAMVLLGANQRALTSTEIHHQAAQIAAVIAERGLPAASGFRLDDERDVSAAVLSLQGSGLIKAYDKADVPVYYIPQGKRLAAAYYRNTITHYFLCTAMGEIGLAMCALDIARPTAETLQDNILSLRDLFKFEFFYQPTEEFRQRALSEIQQRYPDWDSGEKSVEKLLREKPPRFGHAILRSLTESYLVTAVTLQELGSNPVEDRKTFTRQLLAQGEQMLLRRSISCEAAVSQDLFTNALRQAEHLRLLSGIPRQLLRDREAFTQRMVTTLSAINVLQRSYDAAWFSQLSAGRTSTLLGP
jgi:glycerol-3-phosphate O-acyltransferase